MRDHLSESAIATLSTRAWRRIESSQLVVADLDGCLAADNIPLPGAAEFADRLAGKLVVASNNSTHSAHALAGMLQARGLSVPTERFVLAGELAVRIVAQRWPGARVMLLGTQEMREAADRAGLRVVGEAPDVVLLARAVHSRFQELEAAVAALHAGAAFVVANPDRSHPGAAGVPRIETGAILALLQAVLPEAQPLVVGKPAPSLFQAALDIAGVRAEDAVMLGDNAATDIAGARSMGMHTIHLAPARTDAPPMRLLAQQE